MQATASAVFLASPTFHETALSTTANRTLIAATLQEDDGRQLLIFIINLYRGSNPAPLEQTMQVYRSKHNKQAGLEEDDAILAGAMAAMDTEVVFQGFGVSGTLCQSSFVGHTAVPVLKGN
jgi:hypothetical protein